MLSGAWRLTHQAVTTLKNHTFGQVPLLIDGRAFEHCRFTRSVLVTAGVETASFDACEFHRVSVHFAGPAADVLRQLAGYARGDRQTRTNLDALLTVLRAGGDHRAAARVLSWAHLRSPAADVVLGLLSGVYAVDPRFGQFAVKPVLAAIQAGDVSPLIVHSALDPASGEAAVIPTVPPPDAAVPKVGAPKQPQLPGATATPVAHRPPWLTYHAGPPRHVGLRVDEIPHRGSVVVTADGVYDLGRRPALGAAQYGEPECAPSLRDEVPAVFGPVVEELDEAADSLARAIRAETFEAFRPAWKHFLLSLDRARAKIQRLAKFGAGKAWATAEREHQHRDPLLRYLHEARNETEHGVEEVVLQGHAAVGFGPAPGTGGLMPNMYMDDGRVLLEFTHGAAPMQVTHTAWGVQPRPVMDRHGRSWPVPPQFAGLPADMLVLAMGRAALRYYQDALRRGVAVPHTPDEGAA